MVVRAVAIVAFSLVVLGLSTTATASPVRVPGGNGKIVFARSDFEIYSMNPDGTELKQLTDSPGEDLWPVWSADGLRIAFTSKRDGHAEIYVMEADGSNQERVTDTPQPGESWMPSWSPEGDYIAFSTSDYRAADIYKVKPDGTGLTNLTNLPAGHDASYPNWSPDGSRIVYQKLNPGPYTHDICAMNVDGSAKTNLTMSIDDEMTPTWSPDGRSIFYANQGHPLVQPATLDAMDADGGNPRQLSSHHAWRATMSPDGSMILVEGVLEGAGDDLYLLNGDGSGEPEVIGQDWDGLGDWQTVPGTQQPVDPLPRLPSLNTECNAVSEEPATPAPTPGLFPPIGGAPAPESQQSPLTAASLGAIAVGAVTAALALAKRRRI